MFTRKKTWKFQKNDENISILRETKNIEIGQTYLRGFETAMVKSLDYESKKVYCCMKVVPVRTEDC